MKHLPSLYEQYVQALKNIWTNEIRPFLKQWSELITLPAAVVLYIVGEAAILNIDNTAGVYDIGIFQALLLATVALLFGHALIWLVIKIAWPEMYDLLDDCITEEKWLTTWQKVSFSLYYWGFLLLSWAILVAGLS
jgi:hypothetical protein